MWPISSISSIWSAFSRVIRAINLLGGLVGGFLIVVSCVAISYEVLWRYFLKSPHTWSLEFNIFLLIGATFLAGGYTQTKRGHVGTEVLRTLMPERWNRRRILAGDLLSFGLVLFVAVKVWQYAGQAWREGWTTDSVWAPHLWVPYALIGLGMSVLALEYLVQIVEELVPGAGAARAGSDEPE